MAGKKKISLLRKKQCAEKGMREGGNKAACLR